MRRRTKVGLVIVIIGIILIPLAFILYNILNPGGAVEPFNLDDAPNHIIEAKKELKGKLENETLTWDDMHTFVMFSQYMADNCPDILELIKNWDETVLFDFGTTDYMWFFIGSDSVDIKLGTDPPQEYGILIELSFQTFIEIMRQDETPLSSFQKGTLTFDGPFDDVLVIARITEIVSATIMDTNIPPPLTEVEYIITADQSDLYIEDSLTLFPYIQVTVNPEFIGQHHKSTVGLGSVVIVDNYGRTVAELEGSSHTVHKFINSTTIMMGGQEGFMDLWNYKTNQVETLKVPGGHHEIDYNPVTNTYMVLEYAWSEEIFDGKNVVYDKLSEYNKNGEIVWEWDPRIHFPFNATRHMSLGINETFRGGADWMHSNSFAWDKGNEVIYLHVRNLDTILKIDYNTKEILWDGGRDGDFTLFNVANEEVEAIFHHAHSLEQIAPDRFIIYDNDLFNPNTPTTMTLENSSGSSRLLEFEIDEESREMIETWSWTPENETYYFPESGGDADRLPDGNTLGTFAGKALVLNVRDPVIITEVTKEGNIAWELQIPGDNETYYWVHRIERFYEQPLIKIHEKSIDLSAGTLYLNISTWNIFKQDAISIGTSRILADGEVIFSDTFEFLPQWQSNGLEITLDNVPSNSQNIELVIENSDGITNNVIIHQVSEDNFLFIVGIPLLIGSAAVIITSAFILRKRRHESAI